MNPKNFFESTLNLPSTAGLAFLHFYSILIHGSEEHNEGALELWYYKRSSFLGRFSIVLEPKALALKKKCGPWSTNVSIT